MSSRWNRLGFVAPVMMGAALALGGCVDNDISLSINDFVAPDPAGAMSNMCTFDATGSPVIARGTFDLALATLVGSGYDANFEVQNNLEEVMPVQPVEMQAYYIQSFDVILDTTGFANSVISPLKYNYPVSSTRLAPAADAFFSVQAIPAEAVDPLINQFKMASAANKTASVTIHVRPVATRAEEQQVGAYSSFPIDICYGCLTGSATPPTCASLAGQTPLVGNVCNPAADESVTCCMSKAGELVCGTEVTAVATADAGSS